MAGTETHFFLGSNSPQGFYSLYDKFTDPEKDILYIIKGYPGCGKSGFMKRISKQLTEKGLDAEYIHCSGDPDSLDGVYFPELSVGIADGTSPHAIEPRLPGGTERYTDLSRFTDNDALYYKKDEIKHITKTYKACYKRAYDLIGSANSVLNSRNSTIYEASFPVVIKRTRGIITREIKPRSFKKGTVSYRFLSALTNKGIITLYKTADTLCDSVYVFDNEFGLAYIALDMIANALDESGISYINCVSPMAPDFTEHILVPELKLGFISQTPKAPYPFEIARHIRLDAIPDKAVLKNETAKFKGRKKLSDHLISEAVTELKNAKILHDRLEEIYNPHVDFVAVSNLADEYTEKLLKMRK